MVVFILETSALLLTLFWGGSEIPFDEMWKFCMESQTNVKVSATATIAMLGLLGQERAVYGAWAYVCRFGRWVC